MCLKDYKPELLTVIEGATEKFKHPGGVNYPDYIRKN